MRQAAVWRSNEVKGDGMNAPTDAAEPLLLLPCLLTVLAAGRAPRLPDLLLPKRGAIVSLGGRTLADQGAWVSARLSMLEKSCRRRSPGHGAMAALQ